MARNLRFGSVMQTSESCFICASSLADMLPAKIVDTCKMLSRHPLDSVFEFGSRRPGIKWRDVRFDLLLSLLVVA